MTAKGPVLLVDIGSASVGVCIAELNRGGVPVISRTRRVEIENSSGQGMTALVPLALAALKKALAEVAVVSPAPRSAQVVLAAPWYKAAISVINSDSEKPVRIAKSGIEKALAGYTEKNAATSVPGRKTIESVATETYVDGYPTAVSQPVRGSAIAIDYYESQADAPFVSGVEEELRRNFNGVTTEFHSFLFAAYAALRALRDETGFVMLDVGGEITDLAIVHRGGFSFAGSFPFGALSLARAVASGRTLADATSRMSLSMQGELSPEEEASFRESFKKAAVGWNDGYRMLLESAALEVPVPHTTFLIADKEPLAWFERILADSSGPFPIHPILLSPDFFKNAILLGAEGSYDVFLSIAAFYALHVRH